MAQDRLLVEAVLVRIVRTKGCHLEQRLPAGLKKAHGCVLTRNVLPYDAQENYG